MKIVMPMAGRGSRFADRGISTPKPVIDIDGQPMLAWALKSIEGLPYTKIIFVILKEHDDEHGLAGWLKNYDPNCEVIMLDDVTEGQLATVLTARDWINDDEDVLVMSCDTYVNSDMAHDITHRAPDCEGLISVADMPGERWSFARTDELGNVVEVAEKVRISDHASTGLYYFSSGRKLVETGEEMISNQEKTRGEYYVIPVYQKYIAKGWKVGISIATEMWDMGNPEALALFQQHLAAKELE
jgi:dTDP-glucose pyrophosphorylase